MSGVADFEPVRADMRATTEPTLQAMCKLVAAAATALTHNSAVSLSLFYYTNCSRGWSRKCTGYRDLDIPTALRSWRPPKSRRTTKTEWV